MDTLYLSMEHSQPHLEVVQHIALLCEMQLPPARRLINDVAANNGAGYEGGGGRREEGGLTGRRWAAEDGEQVAMSLGLSPVNVLCGAHWRLWQHRLLAADRASSTHTPPHPTPTASPPPPLPPTPPLPAGCCRPDA